MRTHTYAMVFGLLLLLAGSAMGGPERVWQYSAPAGLFDASPGIGDLDGSGEQDLVVVSTAGLAIALDAGGRELWRRELPGPLTVAPSVADVTGGPEPEVLVLNMGGQLFCLDGATGNLLWEQRLPGGVEWGATAILVRDLDGDGAPAIITADNAGHVSRFRGDGSLDWSVATGIDGLLCPAAGDLDGDGIDEVVVTGKQGAAIVSPSGDVISRFEGGPCSSPVLFSRNGRPSGGLVFSSARTLSAYEGAGFTPLWSFELPGFVDSALTAADADGDGEPEFYAVDLVGKVTCLDAGGNLLWDAGVRERVRRSPTVGDVDGDSVCEILVAGYSAELYVFKPGGRLAAKIPLAGPTNASPAVFVPREDAPPLVVVPSSAGLLEAWQWPEARAGADAPWPEYRVNSARTAVVEPRGTAGPRIASVDFGRFHSGHNVLRVMVSNPTGAPAEVRLEVSRDGGAPSASALSSAKEDFTHELAYQLPDDAAASVELRCTLIADGKPVDRRSKRVFAVPFEKEFAGGARLLDELAEAVAQLPDSQSMAAHLALFRERYRALREQKPVAGVLPDRERRAFREDLHALLAHLTRTRAIAGAAREADAPVFLVPANPWAPFGGMDELVEGRTGAGPAVVRGFQGETESAAFNVFNCSDTARIFRVEPQPLSNGAGAAVSGALTLREAVEVPTDMLDLVADALPALNEGSLLFVPAWDARQLWVSVDTAGLAPGSWPGSVLLRSLEVEPAELTADLAIDVWPATLPPEQTLSLCTWGYVHTSVLKDQPEAALRDKVSHGVDIFVGLFHPRAEFDADGNLVGEIDFTEHDAYVKEHAKHGQILFFNYQRALRGPAEPGSETYRKAHIAWLRAWVAHLKAMDVDYDGWALYPVDEPGLSEGLVEQYLLYGRLAREADPEIRLYTDPVARITIEELEAMTPYVDIWCPNRGGFLLKQNADKMAFMQSTGATMWTYECDGYAKHQSPLGYYRALAWLAWRHELTGIGFWSYCTSRHDPWFKPPEQHDYLLIYQGNGVVPSKRWEAVRDGIEDHALLVALRDAADHAREAGRDAELVNHADALLGEQAASIAEFCGLDGDGTTPGPGGMPEERRVADRRWAAIQTWRAQAAELLKAIGK